MTIHGYSHEDAHWFAEYVGGEGREIQQIEEELWESYAQLLGPRRHF